jgi:integrase
MPQRKLTESFVKSATCEPGKSRSFYWDTEVKRFGLMVTSNGHKSYVLQYRDRRTQRQSRMSIPQDCFDLPKAREWARDNKAEVRLGGNPLAERRKHEALKDTVFAAIVENYLAESSKLRSIKLIRSSLERFALPSFKDKQVTEIKKSDIIKLRDRIAANPKHGPGAADHALACLSRALNWHERRSDTYKAPSFKGMALQKAVEQARTRVLSDGELRALWKATDARTGPFRPMMRFLLLTAARRTEAARMTYGELESGDWIIPKEKYKTKVEHVIPLSDAARAVLAGMPRIGKSEYVFATAAGKPIVAFSLPKADLDKDCAFGTPWTIHDLRRTARSLMSRAGVDPDHAERALGHVKPGIRGVYDRHEFYDEKRDAFEKLAAMVARIINPQDNVIPMRSEIPV